LNQLARASLSAPSFHSAFVQTIPFHSIYDTSNLLTSLSFSFSFSFPLVSKKAAKQKEKKSCLESLTDIARKIKVCKVEGILFLVRNRNVSNELFVFSSQENPRILNLVYIADLPGN